MFSWVGQLRKLFFLKHLAVLALATGPDQGVEPHNSGGEYRAAQLLAIKFRAIETQISASCL